MLNFVTKNTLLHVASILNDDICGENGSLVLFSGAEYKLIFYA